MPGGKALPLALACALSLAGCESEEAPEAPGPPASPPQFVERAAEAGLAFDHVSGSPEQRYILESMSAGACFFDGDGDDYQDLFLVNSSRIAAAPEGVSNRLFRNVAGADGLRAFDDVTEAAGLIRGGWGMGCAAGDYDNDGRVDLYVTYWGANHLYRNDGGLAFRDVTGSAGVGDPGWSTSAAFTDLDEDGRLDLFVANYLEFDLAAPPGDGLPCSGWRGLDVYCGPHGMQPQANVLYRNHGDGRFVDRSRETGIDGDLQASLGVVVGDYDLDGDQDLYVANDGYPNLLYRNDGDWRLTETAAWSGAAYSEDGRSQAGMGVAAGDYDADGDLDLIVTHFSDDVNTLYQNQGDGRFRDHTAAAGLALGVRPYLGWGTGFFDADNDGWLDLFVVNGHIYPQVDVHPSGHRYAQRNLLYRNRAGRFEEVGAEAGSGWSAIKVTRGASLGDYDNDGDKDLVFINLNETPDLLHNLGEPAHHWLGIRLIGRRSNRDALGARVLVHGSGRAQMRQVQRASSYLSQNDPRLLFGLGSRTEIDSVVVYWPAGTRQVLPGLAVDRYHVIEEGHEAATVTYAQQDGLRSAATAEAEPSVVAARPAAYRPEPGRTVQEHYDRGRALYEEGRFEEALGAFRLIVENEPEYLPGWYSMAVTLYSGMGRVEEARTVLEQAVRWDSTRVEIYQLLGVIYLNLDQPGPAAAALTRAVSLEPSSWESHARLGLAYIRLDEADKAERAFLAAAARAPHRPQPHLHLAQLYERQGRADEAGRRRHEFERLRPAAEAVERVLRQVNEFPDDARFRHRLGLAYLAQSRYAAAAEAFREALVLDPEMAAAHHGLGGALHLAGRLPAAVEAYRQACRLDPARVAAHADLGQALLEAGRFDEAVSAYGRALSLEPGRLVLRTRRGFAAAAAGRVEEGLADLEAVLAADPASIVNRQALAEVYATAGRLAAAAQQWRQVQKLDPRHPLATGRLQQLEAEMAER